MPDILICGMDMPRSCSECFVKTCKGRGRVKHFTVERDDTCPLVELPLHGDLISRDELLESLRESVDACHKWIDEMRAADDERMVEIAQQSHSTFIEAILRVKAMPVILPASEEESNDPKT